MKNYIYIIPLILLSACLKSPDQKILEIIDVENKIYSTSEDFSPQSIDYRIFESSSNKSDFEVHLARKALYLKLMSTITEPTSEKAIKQKIVSFFEYLDSNLEGRDIPIKITYIFRDKTKKVITKKSNGNEYLDVERIVNETSIFFNIQQKLLFFEELAFAKGVIFDLESVDFLANELCSAVGANNLTYASLLIDISITLFDPGVVRCVSGYPKRHYKGEGSCPMSLRRLSGVNYGQAVSSRISSWQSSGSSFSNIPSLNPVPASMNALLDKHNKWNAGGDCTVNSLLEPGVQLPAGW